MLQDDFDKLMKQFDVSDPSKVNMEDIMGQVLSFFSGLKSEILEASPDEREEIFSNLSGMYTKLMGMTSKLANQMGMSEQDLLKLAEDMKNFTPEQKQLIEKTKSKMMSEVDELGKVLKETSEKDEGTPTKGKKKEGTAPSTQARRGVTRSKWDRA